MFWLPPEAVIEWLIIGASTKTWFCQSVPKPKEFISEKIIPSPAATLASFKMAAYSVAFKTSIVFATCWVPTEVLKVKEVLLFFLPDLVVIPLN